MDENTVVQNESRPAPHLTQDQAKTSAEQRKADQDIDVRNGRQPKPLAAPDLPMRATLEVTEITHTTRGTTKLGLTAVYDSNIKPEKSLLPGARPVGAATIEVPETWAAQNAIHGTKFYLVTQ